MNKLYFAASRLALGCIMASVITSVGMLYMVYDTDYIPLPVMFLLAVVFSLCGYFLKFFLSKLFHGILPEENRKGVVSFVTNNFFPLIAAVALTYLFSLLPDAVFDLFRASRIELLPHQRSVYEFGICSFLFISLTVGMLVHRPDADGYYAEPVTLIVSGGGIGICYIVKLMTASSPYSSETVNHTAYSILLLVVIAAYALLTSQVCVIDIRNSVREFTSERTDTRALLYNYIMLLFVIPFFLLMLLLSWVAVNGVSVLIRLAIFGIFRIPGYDVIGYGARGVVDVLSVFFLAVLAVVFLLRAKLSRLFTAAARIATSIAGMMVDKLLSALKRLREPRKADETEAPSDPKDEEIKRQDALIAEYEFPQEVTVRRDSFDLFLRRLQRIPDPDSRIGFAYRKMCELYRAEGASIKPSDTPREVAKKLTKVSENERATVVRMIEQVKFSSDALTDDDKDRILAELCRIIRRQYI